MKFGRYRVSLVILVGGVLGGLLIVALFALAWQFIDANKPDISPPIEKEEVGESGLGSAPVRLHRSIGAQVRRATSPTRQFEMAKAINEIASRNGTMRKPPSRYGSAPWALL